MALPPYASPAERIWYYTRLSLCALIFLFLIAPILIIIPLSFNVEPYFTFTEKMLTFDPDGYSLRWYDLLLTFGMDSTEGLRDSGWWSQAWEQSSWVAAAKNSVIIGRFRLCWRLFSGLWRRWVLRVRRCLRGVRSWRF